MANSHKLQAVVFNFRTWCSISEHFSLNWLNLRIFLHEVAGKKRWLMFAWKRFLAKNPHFAILLCDFAILRNGVVIL